MTFDVATLLSNVHPLADAVATGSAEDVFAQVDALAYPVLQQALCTVNRYDPSLERVTRLYSSDPVAYPPGGGKDKAGTAWGRHVLHEHKVFVGQGAAQIQAFFNDYQAIASLGLHSVINVPVVLQGRCLGTFNVLMRSEAVDEAMIQTARLAAVSAIPGFLMSR